MNWKIIILIVIVYQYGIVQILVKKIGATEGSRTRKLVWQYFFAALMSLITATIFDKLSWNVSIIVVMGIGAINAFACYCHWRAYDISMSRTAMLANADDLIAIILGYFFLGELKVLTPILTAGIGISIISAIIFTRADCANAMDGTIPSKRLMPWVIGYSIIWGGAIFSMRAFALEGMTLFTFVAAWYIGSWIGALFIRFIMGEKEAGESLVYSQKGKVLILAIGIWTSLMFGYWIRTAVPITIAQPILMVAEMGIPAIIGLILFQERHNLSRVHMLIMFIGLCGVALIALSF